MNFRKSTNLVPKMSFQKMMFVLGKKFKYKNFRQVLVSSVSQNNVLKISSCRHVLDSP